MSAAGAPLGGLAVEEYVSFLDALEFRARGALAEIDALEASGAGQEDELARLRAQWAAPSAVGLPSSPTSPSLSRSRPVIASTLFTRSCK